MKTEKIYRSAFLLFDTLYVVCIALPYYFAALVLFPGVRCKIKDGAVYVKKAE